MSNIIQIKGSSSRAPQDGELRSRELGLYFHDNKAELYCGSATGDTVIPISSSGSSFSGNPVLNDGTSTNALHFFWGEPSIDSTTPQPINSIVFYKDAIAISKTETFGSEVGHDYGWIRLLQESSRYPDQASALGYLNVSVLEISTSDDGIQPIYVRQYKGASGPTTPTIYREAALLDEKGHSSFPGNVKIANKVDMQYNPTYECLNFVFV